MRNMKTLLATFFAVSLAICSVAAHDDALASRKHGMRRRLDTGDASQPGIGDAPGRNSTKNDLQARGSFSGQGTYFYPGQGACGWYASSKDHIAALNRGQYGDMGRRSPHCGQWLKITNRQTGAWTKAQVQDACPGCGYGSLDLSPAAFDDLAPESQGVVQITWDFL